MFQVPEESPISAPQNQNAPKPISQRQLRQWIETSRDKQTDFLGEKNPVPWKYCLENMSCTIFFRQLDC